LIKLLGKKEAHWWFCIYITGSSREECRDDASFEKMFKDLEFVSGDTVLNRKNDELRDFAQGWGYSWNTRDRWHQIYQNIETADTFGNT
jgi:hypothetical protein